MWSHHTNLLWPNMNPVERPIVEPWLMWRKNGNKDCTSSRAVEPEPESGAQAIWDGRSQKRLVVEPEPEVWVPVQQTVCGASDLYKQIQRFLVFNRSKRSGAGARNLSSGSTALTSSNQCKSLHEFYCIRDRYDQGRNQLVFSGGAAPNKYIVCENFGGRQLPDCPPSGCRPGYDCSQFDR